MKQASIVLLFTVTLLSLNCNKKKFFDGPGEYTDGFETYASKDDLFTSDDSKWSFSQVTVDGNTISIDTAIKHSGNKSCRFFAKASGPGSVSKCSIAKQNMAFWEGETLRMDAWYFIEGNSELDWIFLFDMEEQTAIGAGPGTRIAIEGDSSAIVVEHKFNNPNIYQSVPLPFPRNQWVKLSVEVKLSQKKKGSIKVWQNDTLLLEQRNWKTLPKDMLYFIQGTKSMYSSMEFGITANTTKSDVVMYLDDVVLKTIE